MTRGSLKLRLLLTGATSVVLALAAGAIGLLLLFERHVERRMTAELQAHVRQLVGGLERTPDGTLNVGRQPAEPRFDEPLSGLYWQITTEPERSLLRSRSLWDAALDLPSDRIADAEVHEHTVAGPGQSSLLAVGDTVRW
jgi:hypothetical protein